MQEVLRASKVKLYLTKSQKELLDKQLGNGRWVWNHFLALSIRYYRLYGKFLPHSEMYKHYKKIKYREPYTFLQESSADTLSQKLRDLEKAFKTFFKTKKGYPKFKSRHKTIDNLRYERIRTTINTNDIRFERLGNLKFRGKLLAGDKRNITITKTKHGRYFASICYKLKVEPKELTKVIGIDLNCHNITDNEGNKYNLGSYYFQDKIKYYQKSLARKKKGSNNYRKTRILYAKYSFKAACKRKYKTQVLTSKITHASENQAVGVILEDLTIKNMTRTSNRKSKRGLNRSILDSCWGEIIKQLEYKTVTYKVPAHYTSKTCNNCSHVNNELTLGDESWICPECGTEHDRDINAAINVFNKWAKDVLCGENRRPKDDSLMTIPAGISLRSKNMLLDIVKLNT